MSSGYFPIHSHSQNRVSWHLFRAGLSLCGAYSVQETDELELERVAGRRYCGNCTKFESTEQRLGLSPELPLSEADKKFILQSWQRHSAREIAAQLKRPVQGKVSNWARNHCPKKPTNPGRIQPGMASRAAKPEAQETIRKGPRGVSYYFVRGGKYGWQHKHVAIWTAANGPLPEGYIVCFKDGDTLNCKLGNLEAIPKTEQTDRNMGHLMLSDTYVARQLARTTAQAYDHDLHARFLKEPGLLEVKRNHMRLNRAIKSASQS